MAASRASSTTRTQLSKNFYLDEFTRSQTAARFGIDNQVMPGSTEFNHLKHLCQTILQPIRDALGPVHITSGFRSVDLNRKIGGSATSAHCQGLAADFVVSGCTPLHVCQWVELSLNLPYEQCIYEFGEWVHIAATAGTAKQELLTAQKDNEKTVYLPGLRSGEVVLPQTGKE